MEELKRLLINVSDSYYDFVISLMDEARKSDYRLNGLINFIKTHPEAKTSDIIKYTVDDLGVYEEYKSKEQTAMLV